MLPARGTSFGRRLPAPSGSTIAPAREGADDGDDPASSIRQRFARPNRAAQRGCRTPARFQLSAGRTPVRVGARFRGAGADGTLPLEDRLWGVQLRSFGGTALRG